jgi:chromosome segregation protein
MASIIFSGSKSHKPLNFAEVKLTIDNADGWLPVEYEEVCIARRVDRTGQCDYFINGDLVRLKDIRGLLMDTGVGTSSYSFIEQGQIDRILRASLRERRQVFEEAAGIHRFLEQKREAERKLERVANNLARVTDIIEEVSRQLRSVKYHAARARTFKKHTERLEKLRLAHGLHSLRGLEAARDENSRALEETSAERTRLAEAVAAREADLEAARGRLQEAQQELAAGREHLTRIDARLEGLGREAELNVRHGRELDQQIREIGERRAALEARSRELEQELSEAQAGLERSGRELSEKSAEFEARRRGIDETHAERRASEQELESRKARIFDLFQRESHIRNQVEVLGAEKRALQSRLERIDARRQSLHLQLDQGETDLSRTHQTLESLRAEQAGLEEQITSLSTVLDEASAELERIGTEETDRKSVLSGKAGRRDVLRDLEDRAEGLHSGVRRVLEADLPGMTGIVASLLDVPLDLARAAEAALGERVQAVVFEDAAAAAAALRILRDDSAGRAELLVLDQLRPAHRIALTPAPGIEGRLVDLLGFDDRAAAAAEFLLGNTFVVDSGERASALLRTGLPAGVRLVTPTGERYDAGGSWAAGRPETASLISRRSELAALDAEIADLQQQLAVLGDRRTECARRIDEIGAARKALRIRLQALVDRTGEARSHLRVLETRNREVREELRATESESTGLRDDCDRIDDQAAELQQQSLKARGEREDAERTVEAATERVRTLQAREQEIAAEANSLGSELARTREQQRSLQDLVERLRLDKERRDSELSALTDEERVSVRRRHDAAGAVRAAEVEIGRLQEERASLNAELEGRSAQLGELSGRIEGLSGELRRVGSEREEADEKLHELRMAENETKIKMQDLVERTAEDFGVRLQALVAEPESWRERSPFTSRAIREFMDEDIEDRPVPVASWYRKAEADPEDEAEEEVEAPEILSLEEAVALRTAVLEMVDDPETDWSALKAEIAKLKARVDRIGNVNVGAIKEQEELEIRVQFLTDQKEDLEKARRHEREIIRELSRKSRERFVETFEQVRQNFQGLFRKLFGGGSADLLLEEGVEDVLEAGIDLMARPPGKETSTISLLSGGERALTTVALLFAMFQAKPSPFCLLDEMDAPLDDANVERFLMMLNDFTDKTQFVMITHNKLSMSAAEVLYGLTMADGVSKQIVVKFEEVDRKLDQLYEAEPRARAG